MNQDLKRIFDEYRVEYKTDSVSAEALAILAVAEWQGQTINIVPPLVDMLHSIHDAAPMLNITTAELYRMCINGKIHCFHDGMQYQVHASTIKAYIEAHPR